MCYCGRIQWDPDYIVDVVRQEHIEPATDEQISPEQLRMMIRKFVRTEGQVRVDIQTRCDAMPERVS